MYISDTSFVNTVWVKHYFQQLFVSDTLSTSVKWHFYHHLTKKVNSFLIQYISTNFSSKSLIYLSNPIALTLFLLSEIPILNEKKIEKLPHKCTKQIQILTWFSVSRRVKCKYIYCISPLRCIKTSVWMQCVQRRCAVFIHVKNPVVLHTYELPALPCLQSSRKPCG